jgi:hypothetical protein
MLTFLVQCVVKGILNKVMIRDVINITRWGSLKQINNLQIEMQ